MSTIRFACASGVALVCFSIAAADEPQPPSGQLYMSVFLPAEPHRAIVSLDLATGRHEGIIRGGHHPRVSPDGKQMAYSLRNNDVNEVWIKQLDNNDEPRFLWNASSVVRWVNDAKQLILVDGHEGENNRWESVNWSVNADGSGSEQIELPATTSIIDSTADGKRFLVSGIIRGELHSMSADTRKSRLVTKPKSRVYRGRFSPDGSQVAYLTSRKNATVTLVNTDGTNHRVIFAAEGLTEPSEVCWSPDGKHLAVVMFDWIDERQVRHIDKDGNFRILILDTDGKNARPLQLGFNPSEISHLDWK